MTEQAQSVLERPSAAGDWVLSGRLAEESDSRSVTLAPLPFRVGRRSGLSLMLPRKTVSSLHAEFFLQGDKLFLRDLGSTNGTFVNGKPLTHECELCDNDLVQFADAPFRVTRGQPDERSHTRKKDTCDHALAIVQFESLLGGKSLIPNYQPIVDLASGSAIAFEVLARSRLIGLETPDYMFTAATHLGAAVELSEAVRRVAVEDSGLFDTLPHLFMNTHPSELRIDSLLGSCGELRKRAGQQKITIEIHEAAITRGSEMAALRSGLEAMDMTIAFDDFGAGQARIAELIEARPHYLKFDRCIIRELDKADVSRRRLVGGLVSMVRDVGILPVAEGVETKEERDASIDLGFVLAQGYYFGRPMPVAHYAKGVPAPKG